MVRYLAYQNYKDVFLIALVTKKWWECFLKGVTRIPV